MDIRHLDLNLLTLLDALFDEKNVSAAARRVKISQPAASAGLSRLRDFFGDQLFVRTGSGMLPTPFASELAAPVRLILDTLNREILRAPAFDPGETRRCFTICTSDIGELVFLPRLLASLRRFAPHATARSVTVPHAQLERALEDGSIDTALGYFPDLTGANISSVPLFEHPFTCLVRSDHPTIGDRLILDQFLAADHLVVNQEGRSQEIFERVMVEKGLRRRILLHLPHFMSVPQLIRESDMISTVPLTLGLVFGRRHGIRLVDPPIEIPAIPLKQFWHRRLQNDPALSWLRSIVSAEFGGRDPYLGDDDGHSAAVCEGDKLP